MKADPSVDISKLRSELEKEYPSAEIVIEGGKPLIQPVDRPERETHETKRGSTPGFLTMLEKQQKKPLIMEVERERGDQAT